MKRIFCPLLLGLLLAGTAHAEWFLVDTTISDHPGTAHIVGNQQHTSTTIVNRYKKMGACIDALTAYLTNIEQNWKGHKTDIGYYRTERKNYPAPYLQIDYYSNERGLMDQTLHMVQCKEEDR